MRRTQTGIDGDTGRQATTRVSRAGRRATEIEWTRGPQTRAERIRRALIG